MQKRKHYIWLALGMTVIFLLCMGVACSDDTRPDATAKPSATATVEPTETAAATDGQITPNGSAQSALQPTADPATQTQAPVETGDNVVTIPPAWGWGTTESENPAADATETKAPEKTATATETTTEAPAATSTTESIGATQTATPTPTPTTPATPIGTDEEGWIDIWV